MVKINQNSVWAVVETYLNSYYDPNPSIYY